MGPFIGFVVFVVYSLGIWKFWVGYKRTNFQPGVVNRIMLSLLWPVLLISNKSYRQNFQKALKGR
ncbi:MAG: hypothetical protein J7647_01550 [Cyanobacteria bacterium SBLK]|nr:hypothetical protein [Cyanobacteria bacterium SBLK]